MQITTNEFRKGLYIMFQNQPHQIVDLEFVNPGKGSAFFRTKLRSLRTSRVVDFTFKSGESVEDYPIITIDLQYLYRDGEHLIFMDPTSYDQYTTDANVIGGFVEFLRENETYPVMLHEDQIVGIRPPKRVVATV